MLFSDDMRELVELFLKNKVKFAVCGGFAVAHYGFIRATMDFDLLILPEPENAQRIMTALRAFGFGDAGIDETTLTEPGTAITPGAQPNQIDLLTSMSSQSVSDIITNAGTIELQGLQMNVVSLNDLLFAKRESNRAKDRIDAEELDRIREETSLNE